MWSFRLLQIILIERPWWGCVDWAHACHVIVVSSGFRLCYIMSASRFIALIFLRSMLHCEIEAARVVITKKVRI